jgi:hypothetical protein
MDMNDLEDAFDEASDPFGLDDAFSGASPEPTKSWAIEDWINRHGYWIRKRHPVGYHAYPLGLWSITRVRVQEGISIEGDFVRYCDEGQLQEMNQVLSAGMLDELEGLILGVGVKDGPVRAMGKPRIDPFGNPVVESSKGNYGSLTAECLWIENRDDVFIQYMGTDDNWPNGCWAIESKDPDPAYYDADQIRYIAHEILGMPEIVKSRTRDTRVGPLTTDVVVLGNSKARTALAKVGIMALIDEATGYQDDRPADDLRNAFLDNLDSAFEDTSVLSLTDELDAAFGG